MTVRTIFGAFLFVTLVTSCSTPSMRPFARVGYMHLDGDITASAGPVNAIVDVDSLGLGNGEAVPSLGADFEWDPLTVAVEGLVARYDGAGIAEADFSGQGQTITLGTPLESQIDLGLYQARATWDLMPSSPFDVGFGVGGGLIDYGISFDPTNVEPSIDIDENLPFGFLTARVGRKFGDFELLGLASGFGFDFGDEEIQFTEFQGSLIWSLWDMKAGSAALELGYRYIEIDYEFDPSQGNFDVDATLDGFFVGASMRF